VPVIGRSVRRRLRRSSPILWLVAPGSISFPQVYWRRGSHAMASFWPVKIDIAVMKALLAPLLSLFLLPGHHSRAEPAFHNLGFNGKETLMLDAAGIKTTQYPIASADGLTGAPTRKTYKETWVMFIGADGTISKQVLWVFDCTGRAAELAANFSLPASAETSYDLTHYVQGIGVERYMRRFPPTSFYEPAQKIVCQLRGQ
jgi:hypothetical protein